MITPDQFRVNEAWIAVRINEGFMFVQNEPYDIYVLLDAASCYVFGHVVSKTIDEAPPEEDVKELFIAAFQAKNQWAKTLITVEESSSNSVFKKVAKQKGLSVKTVNSIELEPILEPLKESFASTSTR